jgi:hypothetical protein
MSDSCVHQGAMARPGEVKKTRSNQLGSPQGGCQRKGIRRRRPAPPTDGLDGAQRKELVGFHTSLDHFCGLLMFR